jgi:integrase
MTSKSIEDRWTVTDRVTGTRVPSVRHGKGKRWRARYRREAGGRQTIRAFERKVDAQRWLDEVTADIVTGTYVSPSDGRVTFEAFYATWSQRQVWERTTRSAMDLAVGSVTFADVPLQSLRRSHVELWVKAMTAKPLAATTIHTRVNNVRAVLRGAVADRMIPRDPSESVTLPRRRKRAAAMRIPTPAQVGNLLAVADGPFGPFVALCAFAGLRLGEAAAIQVGDVEFLRKTLAVSRQVQRESGGVEVRAPKYGSERTVFLPDAVVTMLAEHIARYRPGDDPERWLFVGEGDLPPHQNTVGHRWRQTLSAAGITGLRLHDLRHFYASGLIAAGCDVVTVQRALGHASATTTLTTYSHLWPTAEDRTRQASADLLTQAVEDSLRIEAAR